jgi:uncharacterized coiled-coil protein SlyX
MNDNDCRNSRRNDPFGREAKRAAWRARRAARHAGRGDWSHFGDPKFWGLDAESMKAWGLGGGMGAGAGMSPSADSVAELEDKVARMEKTIASLNERIIVLERLALNDEARLAAEIERLRETDRK